MSMYLYDRDALESKYGTTFTDAIDGCLLAAGYAARIRRVDDLNDEFGERHVPEFEYRKGDEDAWMSEADAWSEENEIAQVRRRRVEGT